MANKDKIIPIYRDRNRTREAWATLDGSDIVAETSHAEGPPNDLYKMVGKVVSSPSEQYRRNYEQIEWKKKQG